MVLMNRRGFPPDVRVEKETKTLLSHGYRVYLLNGSPEELPQFQIVNGINVYRIRLLWSRPILLSILVNHVKLLFHLVRKIIKLKIPVVHVHDLPFALLVSLVGKILRRKVVYDAHEDHVGMIIGYLKRKGLLRRIYFTIFLFYYIFSEKIVCRLATNIIVVVDENKNRLIKLNVPEDKIVVVSNTADVDKLSKLRKPPIRKKGEIVISYIGGFSYLRGLDFLIKALKRIVERKSGIRLLLVGDGGKAVTELVEMSKQLGVEKYVTFTGWVSFDKAMEYLQESDIGVIPHRSSPHTNSTIPHKLFQYMFYEKPVIVSSVKALKRIVTETGCGLVFRAGNHEELAERLLEAINNASKRKAMGEKGRRAVGSKYNWDIEQKKLLLIYEKLFSN